MDKYTSQEINPFQSEENLSPEEHFIRGKIDKSHIFEHYAKLKTQKVEELQNINMPASLKQEMFGFEKTNLFEPAKIDLVVENHPLEGKIIRLASDLMEKETPDKILEQSNMRFDGVSEITVKNQTEKTEEYMEKANLKEDMGS